MFYSHEILSNQQYGVATIWLVATVGPALSGKRVTKKAIQDVNVTKACETIIEPGAPIALRLQGNLLYGISRVYSHQCGYVLHDAQKIQSDMLLFFRNMVKNDTVKDAGKAKHHQITLLDDPDFDPMMKLPDFDLDGEGFITRRSQKFDSQKTSTQMSPYTQSDSLLTIRAPSLINLDLSQSDSGLSHVASPFGNLQSSARRPAGHPDMFADELDLLGATDIQFDADGNLIDLDLEDPFAPVAALPDDSHNQIDLQYQSDINILGHSGEYVDHPLAIQEDVLPDVEAFPTQEIDLQPIPNIENPDVQDAAPVSVKRGRRAIMLDQQTCFTKNEVTSWMEDYPAVMASRKRQVTSAAQAKKNAFHFVFDLGIANIGSDIMATNALHPLTSNFLGQGLIDNLFEEDSRFGRPGKRRRHEVGDSGEDQEDERHRARPRVENELLDDPQLGLGQTTNEDMLFNDVTGLELGMEAQMAIEDRHSSSAMPWSRQGSAIPPSTQKPGSNASRHVSASPLFGRRGAASMAIERSSPGFAGDSLNYDSRLSWGGDNDDFGAGPFRLPTDQLQAPIEEVNLDASNREFLSFLLECAQGNGEVHHSDSNPERRWVQFDQIIEPAKSTKAVAAQAFYHVLCLSTRNAISVHQEGRELGRPFGSIHIGVQNFSSVETLAE